MHLLGSCTAGCSSWAALRSCWTHPAISLIAAGYPASAHVLPGHHGLPGHHVAKACQDCMHRRCTLWNLLLHAPAGTRCKMTVPDSVPMSCMLSSIHVMGLLKDATADIFLLCWWFRAPIVRHSKALHLRAQDGVAVQCDVQSKQGTLSAPCHKCCTGVTSTRPHRRPWPCRSCCCICCHVSIHAIACLCLSS